MITDSIHRPVVLSFSGHDPCGGAGIQADIEAVTSHQCHSCSVITALTEQDSHNVKSVFPQSPQHFSQQATTLLNDIDIDIIKIGLLASTEITLAIVEILKQHPHIPVVLDPVLSAGGGKSLSNDSLITTIKQALLPLCTVITPNSVEAKALTNQLDTKASAAYLRQLGADFVLITGAHEQTKTVNNYFLGPEGEETFHWQRLAEEYHGSGCTLASSIAALMAHGLDPFTAISEAQEYTWNSLAQAYKPGQGQYFPNRFFWMSEE
jgi:hydroxymethylpyrimidine/phosphomethylpyrimidine kinase